MQKMQLNLNQLQIHVASLLEGLFFPALDLFLFDLNSDSSPKDETLYFYSSSSYAIAMSYLSANLGHQHFHYNASSSNGYDSILHHPELKLSMTVSRPMLECLGKNKEFFSRMSKLTQQNVQFLLKAK